MTATSTLARRFRSQRTDRIRVDGEEVFSKIDLSLGAPTLIEVAFESSRDDCAEGLNLYAPEASLTVVAADVNVEPPAWTQTDQLSLLMPPESVVLLRCEPTDTTHLSIWNTWMHEGTEHAWTGNSGMMIERLDPPPGALERFRLWCSDGFGEPSFDDMVVVLTAGPD